MRHVIGPYYFDVESWSSDVTVYKDGVVVATFEDAEDAKLFCHVAALQELFMTKVRNFGG